MSGVNDISLEFKLNCLPHRSQSVVENAKHGPVSDVPGNRLPERRPVEVAVDLASADRRMDVLERVTG